MRERKEGRGGGEREVGTITGGGGRRGKGEKMSRRGIYAHMHSVSDSTGDAMHVIFILLHLPQPALHRSPPHTAVWRTPDRGEQLQGEPAPLPSELCNISQTQSYILKQSHLRSHFQPHPSRTRIYPRTIDRRRFTVFLFNLDHLIFWKILIRGERRTER